MTEPRRRGPRFGLSAGELAAAHDWDARLLAPQGDAQRAALAWAMEAGEFTPTMLEQAMLERGAPIMDGYKLIQRLVHRGWLLRMRRGVYMARYKSSYLRWKYEQAAMGDASTWPATAEDAE